MQKAFHARTQTYTSDPKTQDVIVICDYIIQTSCFHLLLGSVPGDVVLQLAQVPHRGQSHWPEGDNERGGGGGG